MSVKFDLKFDYEELQDIFWIEQTEDEEQGVYSLVVRVSIKLSTSTYSLFLMQLK